MPLTSLLVIVLAFQLVVPKKVVAGSQPQLASPGRDGGNQRGLDGASGRCHVNLSPPDGTGMPPAGMCEESHNEIIRQKFLRGRGVGDSEMKGGGGRLAGSVG